MEVKSSLTELIIGILMCITGSATLDWPPKDNKNALTSNETFDLSSIFKGQLLCTTGASHQMIHSKERVLKKK